MKSVFLATQIPAGYDLFFISLMKGTRVSNTRVATSNTRDEEQ